MVLFLFLQIVGDGSSSNSESSLGSSSGYGSQNTVKVDEINQQIQKQKQNRIDGQNQHQGINSNVQQRSTDGKKTTFPFMSTNALIFFKNSSKV